MRCIFAASRIGLVVQLVRIHACHAWGRGFESRPDRILLLNVKILKCCVACKPLVYKRFVREPMRSFPENGRLFLFFIIIKIEGFTVYEKFID